MNLNIEQFLSNLAVQDLTILAISLSICVIFSIVLIAKNNTIKKEKLRTKDLHRKNFELQTILQQEQKYAGEKFDFLQTARQEMSEHFSAIAQHIIEDKGKQLNSQNREKLSDILLPLQEQITSFKSNINEIYFNETKERASLRQEIVHLRQLSSQINEEAVNLTRALKGDKQVQGAWGELILEKVLEQSGLRKDHEYTTQTGFRDQDNQLFKPDAIIHLPGGRDVIVDSKVSLISWERFVNSDNEDEKKEHLSTHVSAIKRHISGLSQKNYSDLKGIKSLDFILMFMPIEAAHTVAFQKNQNIFTKALQKNIIVVTPTTLLATIRTIENLWQQEKQSKNSLEIANRAATLYDKFRGFVEEMDKLGQQINSCQTTYSSTMNKLNHGKGNLVSQAQKLTELGITVKKEIPKTILEESDLRNYPN